MINRDLIVVGASAGGVEALRALVGGLPADLPATVLVVLHVPREFPSALPRILARAGRLPAAAAVDGTPLRPGHIWVAPGDRHLLVLDGRLRLSLGPSENGHRPAVDPLFRSAARAAGARVIAVVLSGSRDDGAVGAASVAAHGGLVLVQDPQDALYPSMPRSTIARVKPDHVASAAALGKLLGELVAEPVIDPRRVASAAPEADELLDREVAISDFVDVHADQVPTLEPGYGCPVCGGSLAEIDDQGTPRYRCRIGHAWSPESLLDEQAVATEGALWTALRALEEKSALGHRLAGSWAGQRQGARFDQMAAEAEGAGTLIRELLNRLSGTSATREE